MASNKTNNKMITTRRMANNQINKKANTQRELIGTWEHKDQCEEEVGYKLKHKNTNVK